MEASTVTAVVTPEGSPIGKGRKAGSKNIKAKPEFPPVPPVLADMRKMLGSKRKFEEPETIGLHRRQFEDDPDKFYRRYMELEQEYSTACYKVTLAVVLDRNRVNRKARDKTKEATPSPAESTGEAEPGEGEDRLNDLLEVP